MIAWEQVEALCGGHARKFLRLGLFNVTILNGQAWIAESEFENLRALIAAGGPPERKDPWLAVVSPRGSPPPKLASRAQTGAARYRWHGRQKKA
jgi:hypothetical protein